MTTNPNKYYYRNKDGDYVTKQGFYTTDGMHKRSKGGLLTRNGCQHYNDCFTCPLPDCFYGCVASEVQKILKRETK